MSTMKEIIHYYQKKINRFKNDDSMIIDSIQKIAKLPVTAEILQETGIYNIMHILSLKGGDLGAVALPIFNKWRLLVTIAMKDRESPTISPDQAGTEERSRSTPGNHASSFSKSSADSNASHGSRDTDSGRSSKYSDPSQFGRRGETFAPERESSAPSSSSDHNGLPIRDSYHFYEDGAFNPHLSIDNSDKMANSSTDEASESHGAKNSKILEPYSIEMREGMFRVVKVKSKNSFSPAILRQIYQKEFLRKSTTPYKERDKSENSKNKNSEVSSSIKNERSVSSAKDQNLQSQQNDRERQKRKTDSSKNGSMERIHTIGDKAPKSKTSSETRHSTYSSKSDGRGSSPSISSNKSENRGVDKKRLERKLTPDSTPEKLKFKSIKEERSPSHMSKMSNADNHQANCDRKIMKIMDSPDSAAMKFITSKKDRRAVYSGKRLPGALSLQESCVRVLKKHVDYLKSTRKMPYKVLKPVLEHLTPMQLYKVEEQNRYLMKETDELWKQHCIRDYRGLVLNKSESWRTMYYKAFKEQDRKLKNLTASISASALKTRPDRQTKITLVDSPLDPQRKRLKRSDSPVMPLSSGSPLLSSKLSPNLTLKASPNVSSKSSPNMCSKSSSPNFSLKAECSKSSSKEAKAIGHHPKPPKKADAPLMSKLKRSMGLAYRSK